jgi:acyl-CoA synthetase (AMP-forming)/AMP-acid ligase II
MPDQSPYQIHIPATDVLSYLFPPGSTPSDKPIWIDAVEPEHSLSPRQLLQWAKRLGLGLHGLGLKEGDVVMVYSHNHIFVPVAYLGIAGSGFIFSGTNPAYTVDGKFLPTTQ